MYRFMPCPVAVRVVICYIFFDLCRDVYKNIVICYIFFDFCLVPCRIVWIMPVQFKIMLRPVSDRLDLCHALCRIVWIYAVMCIKMYMMYIINKKRQNETVYIMCCIFFDRLPTQGRMYYNLWGFVFLCFYLV
jgi:hypothetical protein